LYRGQPGLHLGALTPRAQQRQQHRRRVLPRQVGLQLAHARLALLPRVLERADVLLRHTQPRLHLLRLHSQALHHLLLPRRLLRAQACQVRLVRLAQRLL